MQLAFPDAFPAAPPAVKFDVPVWHPLVSADAAHSGKLCEDYMKEQWALFKPPAAPGVRDVLVILRRLLAQPHVNNDLHVNSEAKEELKDLDRFDAHAKAWTEKHAT